MLIHGKNAVMESLRAHKAVYKIYIQDTLKDKSSDIINFAYKQNISVEFVPKDKLSKMSEHHQGYVAETEDYQYCEVEDILNSAKAENKAPFVVILDGIVDPQNLGSIIRVCECAGVSGIIIPKHRACPINNTVAKTSAGALNYVKIAKVTNLNQTIKALKQAGLWIYAVELGGTDIYATDLKGALGIVIGSEGEGVSQLVKSNCDGILSIDMFGKVNSLNASAACAVAVFEAVRQRR